MCDILHFYSITEESEKELSVRIPERYVGRGKKQILKFVFAALFIIYIKSVVISFHLFLLNFFCFSVIGHEGAIARKLEFKSNATLVIGKKEGICISPRSL